MKNEIDMLHGPMTGKIMKVALPLAAISILQQFFNAADVAVVGRFASSQALAAVGANTPVVNTFITFFSGLAVGGNVTISRFIGQGRQARVTSGVQTVFTLSLISGVLLVVVGELLAAPILDLIEVPPAIKGQALLYLRIYFFAMAFSVIYNFVSAVLRSRGDTRRPLYCLIAAGIINVILNLVFVIGFSMDVMGVALATLIANFICAAASTLLLVTDKGPMKLSLTKLSINWESLGMTLRIGLPAGFQGMTFSVSNIIIQYGINGFDSDCIAGNTAAMNFEFISFFVVSAFGQTATTFTSQNFGAGNYQRCRRVMKECLFLGISLCILVSGCFVVFKDFWLGLFTSESGVMVYALIRMKYVVALECLTGFNEIPASALRGLGISVPPTIVSISGSCILRIIWILTVFRKWHSIETLMLVYPVSWVFLLVVMIPLYLILSRRLYASMENKGKYGKV